ncbi:MAG TPA: DUF1772 domain-containing protein [Acidimicrobiales bacterium]|nr:DUF1772 domain-containing protein [Acidimicrobiales bacterium]
MGDETSARTRRLGATAMCLATMCTGLMAGVVLAYAIAVMPGLEQAGDQSFVDAFQRIDHALDRRLWFWMAIFLGGMGFVLLSLAFTAKSSIKSPRTWLVIAAVLYAATIAVTGLGIDPLENAFGDAADSSAAVDPSMVRAALDEDRWVLLNNLRLATTTAAFASMAWSLVVFGRSHEPDPSGGAMPTPQTPAASKGDVAGRS